MVAVTDPRGVVLPLVLLNDTDDLLDVLLGITHIRLQFQIGMQSQFPALGDEFLQRRDLRSLILFVEEDAEIVFPDLIEGQAGQVYIPLQLRPVRIACGAVDGGIVKQYRHPVLGQAHIGLHVIEPVILCGIEGPFRVFRSGKVVSHVVDGSDHGPVHAPGILKHIAEFGNDHGHFRPVGGLLGKDRPIGISSDQMLLHRPGKGFFRP